EPVEKELPEPRLVDPFATERPGRQRVVRGEAVTDDLAAAEDRVPAVGEELTRQVQRERDDVERDDREEQGLAKAPRAEARGLSQQEPDARRPRADPPVRNRLDVLHHPS